MALLGRASLHAALAPTKLLQPLARIAPTAWAFARDWLQPEPAATSTRFNAVVSAHRVFDTRRFLRREFESIRALVPGATLQDAVLAVCAGGLRRYLLAQAELPQADLSASLTPPADAGLNAGERAPPRIIPLGTALADALQRLAWIQRQTALAAPAASQTASPEASPEASHSASPAASLTKRPQRSLSPSPSPSCSVIEVPGPSAPVYLHGARLTYFSAILPIKDGMGLVFAVTDYDGRIVISPTSCRDLLPDPQAFTQCVRDSFQEYWELAQRAAPAAGVMPAAPRASTAGKPRPPARKVRSAATPPRAATAARRRSTTPSR